MKKISTFTSKFVIAFIFLSLTGKFASAQFFALGTSVKTSTSYTILIDRKDNFNKLRFTSFDAAINSNKVELNWLPEQQMTENSYFEIERSFDMTEYKTVATVLDGMSVDGSSKLYKYKGNTEAKGQNIVYYRIKQVNADNRIVYSNVIAVMI